MYPFVVKRPWGSKAVTKEDVIVAEQNFKLEFLRKLKLYTELVPETVP